MPAKTCWSGARLTSLVTIISPAVLGRCMKHLHAQASASEIRRDAVRSSRTADAPTPEEGLADCSLVLVQRFGKEGLLSVLTAPENGAP